MNLDMFKGMVLLIALLFVGWSAWTFFLFILGVLVNEIVGKRLSSLERRLDNLDKR